MLVERDIIDSYTSQIGAATKEQIEALDTEVKNLCLWGERWGRDSEDAEIKMTGVPMLFRDEKGEVTEIEVDRVVWDLESTNRIVLKHLDDRVVGSYIAMKKAGFARPSSLLYVHMYRAVLSKEDLIKSCEEDRDFLRGLTLVVKRLRSTCRVAFRFDNEVYHRRVVYGEDGSAEICFGKSQWRRELVARKVIKGRG